MQIEILIVIITSIVTLVTVIANIIVTSIIAGKQNLIELKKTRITVLEMRREAIEKAKSEISERVFTTVPGNIMDKNVFYSNLIVFFQQNRNSFFSIGHFLNQEFVNKVEELNKKIEIYIANDKIGVPNNQQELRSDLQLLMNINSEMNKELQNKLRAIEENIERLMEY